MLGALNKLQIDFLLRREMVGRIGCSAGGMTYVVPITYVYDGENILAHTREGLKIEMMRENPIVCFEVDHVENMANWQSVIIQGQFEALKGKAAEDAVQLLVNRLHPLVNSETMVPRHALEPRKTPVPHDVQVVVFRIAIKDVSGKFEKQ